MFDKDRTYFLYMKGNSESIRFEFLYKDEDFLQIKSYDELNKCGNFKIYFVPINNIAYITDYL